MLRTYAQKSISVTLSVLLLSQLACPPSASALSADEKARLQQMLAGPDGRRQGGDDSPAEAQSLAIRNQGVLHSDQEIRPGDTLYFAVSPADELSREMVVDQNGKISIPLIGAVEAAGKTTDELSAVITKAISKYVAHPKVDIFLKQSVSKQLSLAGQVTMPGSYAYRPNERLLDLIGQAGGFLASADRKKVRILRRAGTDRRVIVVNVEEVMASGDPNKDILLEPGDLVEVSRGRGGIAIFGTVVAPGVYDFIYEMRIIDLISACHGFGEGANDRRIMVIRGEGPAQTTMYVNFDQVVRNNPRHNILLQPGDIVYVPQRSLWRTSALASAFMPICTILLTVATIILATKH